MKCDCGSFFYRFKDTIGEMKYILKSNEFIIAMHSLAGMVQMETNPEILDVHIVTYIPAPPRCNQLVINYKQLCTSRKMHLMSAKDNKSKSSMMEEDVFLIDD